MSTDAKEQGAIDGQRFENFQKEVDRKLGNTNAALEALKKTNEQLVASLAQSKQSSKQKKEVSEYSTDLLYSDPDKWAKLQKDSIKSEINEENSRVQQNQQKVQQTLSRLSSDYPELADPNSDLARKAISIFDSYAEDDKANAAVSYKAAIMEAVADLGVKKISQRNQNEADIDHGDFVVSGHNQRRNSNEKKPKLDSRTVEFAELMGLDTENKDVLKRLANRGKRDFSKYGN